MRLLLDTHLLLWAASQPRRLSKKARALLNDADHELWFSAASLWEVIIKSQLGRKDFKVDARPLRRGLLANGYVEVAVSSEHVVAVSDLPPLHKDPFDRILIAQAVVEDLTLLTSDQRLAQYPHHVRAV